MNNRKARQRKLRNRRIALTLVLMLVVAVVSVGGTIAWLKDSTGTVKNTFTAGDINIDLKEHDYVLDTNSLDKSKEVTEEKDYVMVPGNVLPKDPFVTVEAGSEACWLFVKVEKGNNVDTYLDYSVDSGWTKLQDQDNVYYREVAASDDDQTFDVLTSNQVTVKNVTSAQLETAENANPTLTFTAYAVQKANVGTAAEAWTIANTAE